MRRGFFQGLAAAAAACASLAAAQPAAATVLVATYTGHILGEGIDTFGLFGDAGAALGGAAYTAVFRFDTAIGEITQFPDAEISSGGDAYPKPSPDLGAVVTIGGHSYAVSGANHGYHGTDSFFGKAEHKSTTANAFGGEDQLDGFINGIYDVPARLDVPYSVTIDPEWFGGHLKVTRNGETELLSFSSLTYSIGRPAGAAPEPSAWALAVLGFGALGATLRRRRAYAQAPL